MILNGAHNALPTAFVTGQSTLQVNGTLEAIIDIGGASRLSGSGTVGNTSIQHGSTLSPGQSSIGTLTVNGDLTLHDGSILDYQLGGPGTSSDPASGIGSRVNVTGNLTLNGALNLRSSSDTAQDGVPGLGYYRLMTYGGTLSGTGLSIGSTPVFSDPAHFEIQAGGGNVDLFIAALGHDTLQHWQGGWRLEQRERTVAEPERRGCGRLGGQPSRVQESAGRLRWRHDHGRRHAAIQGPAIRR